MRVGDITYFAPSVPFAEVDLSGDALPEQILARIEGYYLQAADSCVREGFAFAAGVLYDAYRNGLVHEECLKEGCQFALGLDRTLDRTGAFPVVDAGLLLHKVRKAVCDLVE